MNIIFSMCTVFLGIGVLMFIMAISQTWLLAKAGARLTQRVRLVTFAAMLRQECGWFDEEENSIGILASHLSSDAANVQTVCTLIFCLIRTKFIIHFFCQAVGFPLSVILQSTSTVVLGIIIAFSTSIKLSAVCLSAFFLMVAIVLLEARY